MTFWDEEEKLTAPTLLQADIHRIQTELTGRFPESYLEKLSEQNGGSDVFNAVSMDFENTWSESGAQPFLPFSFIQPLSYDVYQSNVGTLPEWDVTGKKMIFAHGGGSLLAYSHWMVIGQEPERLVRELMQRIEQSNNEDQIDSYAGYLAETMINHSEKLQNSLEDVIDLLKSKHLITDLSDLIEWLDEEM
ncbi:hypothetical protein QK289_04350 [Exiguobacterium antarcticum]|uniref:Knr4/Smi1-like domain-containing protein n=1 Tax=Exiguobacterium antarcticum TaxID=132920 RepID=A0ABT6QZW5_9BACL|nr:hypothetical protein [Exiguobacterium antarcticum]MDI3234229.1 hypothetical protein [Exiguobacterium antarcticum]